MPHQNSFMDGCLNPYDCYNAHSPESPRQKPGHGEVTSTTRGGDGPRGNTEPGEKRVKHWLRKSICSNRSPFIMQGEKLCKETSLLFICESDIEIVGGILYSILVAGYGVLFHRM